MKEKAQMERLGMRLKERAKEDLERHRQEEEKTREQQKLREAERDPQKVIRQYEELEVKAGREARTATDFHRRAPEVKTAQEMVDRAEGKFRQATRERKKFEKEHPVKARMGTKKIVELRLQEESDGQALDIARKSFSRTWENPRLQKRSKEEARAYMKEIEVARAGLKELGPFYERAVEARDLEYVNERLDQHVQGRDSAGEYRERLGGLQKRYGKAFDPRKADWVISKDLAKEGFSGGQIMDALRKESPALKGLSSDRSESYVNRTVDRVMDLGEVKEHRQEKSRGIDMFLSL